MFQVNNYWIDEVLRVAIRDFYTEDVIGIISEVSDVTLNINTEPKELHNRKGQIEDIQYLAKNGEISLSNAFLSTVIQSVSSGSEYTYASAEGPLTMPRMGKALPGGTLLLENPVEGTVLVVGMNSDASMYGKFTQSTSASLADKTYTLDNGDMLSVPAYDVSGPIYYLVIYRRKVISGIELTNKLEKFPDKVKLDIMCSYWTPCGDTSACYLYVPCCYPSPDMEIRLDENERNITFNGKLLKDPCNKEDSLYYLYFPEGEAVETDGYSKTDRRGSVLTTEDLNNMWNQTYEPSSTPAPSDQVITIPELEAMWERGKNS